MSLYSLPVLLGAIFSFLAGWTIFLLNRRSQVNIALSLFCASLFVWLFGYFIAYSITDMGIALIFCHVACMGAMFSAPTFYHFTVAFLDRKSEIKYVVFSYIAMTIMAPLSLVSDWFLSGVYHYFWGYYSKAGYLHPLYLVVFFAIFLRGFYLFWLEKKKKDLSPKRRVQINFAFIAYVIILIASIDYIPKYGIQMYPFGFIFGLLFVVIVSYAIVKHQLLGIDVIIKRTLVFAGLFAASYAIFASFAYLGSLIFENVLQNRWIALVPSVFVIVLMMQPLKRVLVNVTDRFLFQKKYDYKELLKTFSGEVLTVLNIGALGELTVSKLSEIMKLNCAAVLLCDDAEDDHFQLLAYEGNEVFEKCDIPCSDELLRAVQKKGYCTVGINRHGPDDDVILPQDICEKIRKLGGEMVIALPREKSILGLLVMGSKKSDEDFTQDDIDILLPLAGTIAIAITNARLIAKLSQAQAQAAQREKMAVIGTLSAGINHEICNPLGIIRGQCELFLLNKEEGFYDDVDPVEVIEKARQIMEKVIGETDRASSITKRLSAFSKPAKDEKEDNVSLEKEIEEVIALVEHDLKLDNVEIKKEIPEDLPCISADRKQIQEIFFNLIRNAAQAIKGSGVILIKAVDKEDSIQVDIKDTGGGITPEQLAQIWDPFFTTKEPGRGTGLGLFIVKQIVERNNGHISVKSEPGKGTDFKLVFKTVSQKVA